MKIAFSYNQVSQIQIATVRRQEAYDLVRSYFGIPVGHHFDNSDLIDGLLGDTFLKYVKDMAPHISIRGTEIDLDVCLHAIRTLIAIENIQVALNAFSDQEATLSDVRKVVKHAKSMIDAVEW